MCCALHKRAEICVYVFTQLQKYLWRVLLCKESSHTREKKEKTRKKKGGSNFVCSPNHNVYTVIQSHCKFYQERMCSTENNLRSGWNICTYWQWGAMMKKEFSQAYLMCILYIFHMPRSSLCEPGYGIFNMNTTYTYLRSSNDLHGIIKCI